MISVPVRCRSSIQALGVHGMKEASFRSSQGSPCSLDRSHPCLFLGSPHSKSSPHPYATIKISVSQNTEPLTKEVQLIRKENENFDIKAETMMVDEVKRQRSMAKEFYVICKVKITSINSSGSWHCQTCHSHYVKLEKDGSKYYCSKCKGFVTTPYRRFKVHVRAEDNSGSTTLTLFDSIMKTIIDETVENLHEARATSVLMTILKSSEDSEFMNYKYKLLRRSDQQIVLEADSMLQMIMEKLQSYRSRALVRFEVCFDRLYDKSHFMHIEENFADYGLLDHYTSQHIVVQYAAMMNQLLATAQKPLSMDLKLKKPAKDILGPLRLASTRCLLLLNLSLDISWKKRE
ncbi:hypothetical protein Sjap_011154 [Stephania japonica]|uniref:Replication factor A C-terminal domain-containing protein n=1 Tax=Stephania japonica TaxID=461633 RepID=A0AAP0JCY6_9MAGN